jgi:hypothetical protein
VNRILKSVIFALAAIYFLVDGIFMIVARPVANRITEHWIFGSLRVWILSLRPYPTLALFAVPLIVLEPVKPVAAYLAGTGHIAVGMIVLVIGEVLKLVLVERLFSVSRNKLISIPAFAWTYGRYLQAKEWLESFDIAVAARRTVRLYAMLVASFIVVRALPLVPSFQQHCNGVSQRGNAEDDHQDRRDIDVAGHHDRPSRVVGTIVKPASSRRRRMISAAASGSMTSAGKSPLPSKSASTSCGVNSLPAPLIAGPPDRACVRRGRRRRAPDAIASAARRYVLVA